MSHKKLQLLLLKLWYMNKFLKLFNLKWSTAVDTAIEKFNWQILLFDETYTYIVCETVVFRQLKDNHGPMIVPIWHLAYLRKYGQCKWRSVSSVSRMK